MRIIQSPMRIDDVQMVLERAARRRLEPAPATLGARHAQHGSRRRARGRAVPPASRRRRRASSTSQTLSTRSLSRPSISRNWRCRNSCRSQRRITSAAGPRRPAATAPERSRRRPAALQIGAAPRSAASAAAARSARHSCAPLRPDDAEVGEVARRSPARRRPAARSTICQRPARGALARPSATSGNGSECTGSAAQALQRRGGVAGSDESEPDIEPGDQCGDARTIGRHSRGASARRSRGTGHSRTSPSRAAGPSRLQHRQRPQRRARSRGRTARIEILPDRPARRGVELQAVATATGRCGRRPRPQPAGVSTAGRARAIARSRAAPSRAAPAPHRGRPSSSGVTTKKPALPSIGRLSRDTVCSAQPSGREATRRDAAAPAPPAARAPARPRASGGIARRACRALSASATFCAARSSCQKPRRRRGRSRRARHQHDDLRQPARPRQRRAVALTACRRRARRTRR